MGRGRVQDAVAPSRRRAYRVVCAEKERWLADRRTGGAACALPAEHRGQAARRAQRIAVRRCRSGRGPGDYRGGIPDPGLKSHPFRVPHRAFDRCPHGAVAEPANCSSAGFAVRGKGLPSRDP